MTFSHISSKETAMDIIKRVWGETMQRCRGRPDAEEEAKAAGTKAIKGSVVETPYVFSLFPFFPFSPFPFFPFSLFPFFPFRFLSTFSTSSHNSTVFPPRRYNHVAYRVEGIDWGKKPSTTFTSRRKKGDGFEEYEVSFNDYFRAVSEYIHDFLGQIFAVKNRKSLGLVDYVLSIDWLIDRLIDFRLIDWLVDWLVDWLIAWFVDWLIDWWTRILRLFRY